MIDTWKPEVRETLALALATEEKEIFQWLRQGYTFSWIAETALRRETEIRRKAKEIFRSLGVRNQRELVRWYGALERTVPAEKETA